MTSGPGTTNGEGLDVMAAHPAQDPETAAREQDPQAAWQTVVGGAIREGMVRFDENGSILEVNQAFTDLLGYEMGEDPFTTPHPWWPTEAEDPDGFLKIRRFFEEFRVGRQTEGDLLLFDLARQKVWVHARGVSVANGAEGTTYLWLLRDAMGEREAQRRRSAAAELSHDFAVIDDLGVLIRTVQHRFALFFDGVCTVQVTDENGTTWFTDQELSSPEALPPEVRAGLAGGRSADTESLRPGILLLPPAANPIECRAWVQFPRPRRIGIDRMLLADLLAAGFAAAIQRLVAVQETTKRVANLQLAMESHRLVGQATGVLVERHRITPTEAFEMLRQASQHRNVKIRELAAQLVETGLEPDEL